MEGRGGGGNYLKMQKDPLKENNTVICTTFVDCTIDRYCSHIAADEHKLVALSGPSDEVFGPRSMARGQSWMIEWIW